MTASYLFRAFLVQIYVPPPGGIMVDILVEAVGLLNMTDLLGQLHHILLKQPIFCIPYCVFSQLNQGYISVTEILDVEQYIRHDMQHGNSDIVNEQSCMNWDLNLSQKCGIKWFEQKYKKCICYHSILWQLFVPDLPESTFCFFTTFSSTLDVNRDLDITQKLHSTGLLQILLTENRK